MRRIWQFGLMIIFSWLGIELTIAYSEMAGVARPFLLSLFVVTITCLYGGWLLGIIALLLTGFFETYFFLTPLNIFSLSASSFVQLVTHLAEGLIIIWLVGKMQEFRAKEQVMRQYDDQRELLLGVASHELKNHIAGMKGYTQLLRINIGQNSHNQYSAFVQKMERKINILTDISDNLVNVTKLRAGTLDLKREAFNINTVVKEVVEDMQVNSNKHKIAVNGDVNEQVVGDKTKINQVLTNLLSNASKYSPHSNKIVVGIFKDKDQAVVKVQDFGLGIPQEKLNRLFEPFYRAVSPEDKKTISGSGLGLYISSEIIKQNRGKMWVESEEGRGSSFYFSLPITSKLYDIWQKKAEENTLEKIRQQISQWFCSRKS